MMRRAIILHFHHFFLLFFSSSCFIDNNSATLFSSEFWAKGEIDNEKLTWISFFYFGIWSEKGIKCAPKAAQETGDEFSLNITETFWIASVLFHVVTRYWELWGNLYFVVLVASCANFRECISGHPGSEQCQLVYLLWFLIKEIKFLELEKIFVSWNLTNVSEKLFSEMNVSGLDQYSIPTEFLAIILFKEMFFSYKRWMQVFVKFQEILRDVITWTYFFLNFSKSSIHCVK